MRTLSSRIQFFITVIIMMLRHWELDFSTGKTKNSPMDFARRFSR